VTDHHPFIEKKIEAYPAGLQKRRDLSRSSLPAGFLVVAEREIRGAGRLKA
jgi:hypothetical protein